MQRRCSQCAPCRTAQRTRSGGGVRVLDRLAHSVCTKGHTTSRTDGHRQQAGGRLSRARGATQHELACHGRRCRCGGGRDPCLSGLGGLGGLGIRSGVGLLAQQVKAACRHQRGAARAAPLGAQSSESCRAIRSARHLQLHGDGHTHSRRQPRGDQRPGTRDWHPHPQRDGGACRGCAHGESPPAVRRGTLRCCGLGQRLQIGRVRHRARQSRGAAARPWCHWPFVVQRPAGFAKTKCPVSSDLVDRSTKTGRASLSKKGRVRRRLRQPRDATRFDAR